MGSKTSQPNMSGRDATNASTMTTTPNTRKGSRFFRQAAKLAFMAGIGATLWNTTNAGANQTAMTSGVISTSMISSANRRPLKATPAPTPLPIIAPVMAAPPPTMKVKTLTTTTPIR